MPRATRVITRADPPLETRGRGSPITGSTPITVPMLMIAWPSTQASTPPVAMVTNRSSLVMASRNRPTPSAAKRTRTARVPARPSSSPMVAKM